MVPETKTTPTILVIVGITGDLARRKLLPAVIALKEQGKLSGQFHLVGITRQGAITLETIGMGIKNFESISDVVTLFPMNMDTPSEYGRLAAYIAEIEKDFAVPTLKLLYLSVPPKVSHDIIGHFGTSGIAQIPQTKLLLEKPFGSDIGSAQALIAHINAHFASESVYRIDHYLAKEMVQDLIATLKSDTPINRIDIIATETIGIEGRAGFYEQTGALRDMVQSHLLQFAATVLRDGDDIKTLREQRLVALQQLRVVPSLSVRGQYENYRNEVNTIDSTVETFVSLLVQSSDPRFISVPITIATGKKLDKKLTEIRISYTDDRKDVVYTDQSNANAYERVLEHAIEGNIQIFISDEEVLECWRIITPLLELWQHSTDDLQIYANGSAPDGIQK